MYLPKYWCHIQHPNTETLRLCPLQGCLLPTSPDQLDTQIPILVATKTMVHSFISFHLNHLKYCHDALAGPTGRDIPSPIHRSVTAHVISCLKKLSHHLQTEGATVASNLPMYPI